MDEAPPTAHSRSISNPVYEESPGDVPVSGLTPPACDRDSSSY